MRQPHRGHVAASTCGGRPDLANSLIHRTRGQRAAPTHGTSVGEAIGHNPAVCSCPAPAPDRARDERPLLSIIQAAGWPIWPLILCSVVATALIIERFYSLRTSQVAPPKLLDEVLGVTRASLPSAEVVNRLSENSVLGRVLAAGLRSVIADPRITESALRQQLENAGRAAVGSLERYLNALGTIASAAPLLGLLGTVIGMIEIFGSQAPTAGAAGNPQQLAHGISIALYNTAFGLIVAIPALMVYRYFRRRVEEYGLALELAAERLVPHLMRFAVKAD